MCPGQGGFLRHKVTVENAADGHAAADAQDSHRFSLQ